MMLKLIVLDRDGVINEDSPYHIRSPEEWHAISGSLDAIAKLRHNGYPVVVVTNQSGIAKGFFTVNTLDLIHKKMVQQVEDFGGRIDGIFFCPHSSYDNCSCRKPKPGLLLEAAKKFKTKPNEMLVVGDKMSDVLAAKACGASAFLVRTGQGKKTLATSTIDVPVYDDLMCAVNSLIKK